MEENSNVVLADMDEIVFETREREYGAYELRKKYNRNLMRGMIIAFLMFIGATGLPKVVSWLTPNAEMLDEEKVVSMNITDLPPPPSLDDEPPPPPPEVDIPPPKIKTIEFKVPVPKPDEEIIEEETIHEMEEIEEETNIGLEDVEGDSVGYDFGEIEGTGDVVAEIEQPEPEPDPRAFIMVEKTPNPVNMDNIKKLIGYPATAKEAEIEGKVILRILVDKGGKYKKHIVIKNPHPILTKEVEKHVNKLSFTPGIQAGKPIQVWVTIPFDFKLLR